MLFLINFADLMWTFAIVVEFYMIRIQLVKEMVTPLLPHIKCQFAKVINSQP